MHVSAHPPALQGRSRFQAISACVPSRGLSAQHAHTRTHTLHCILALLNLAGSLQCRCRGSSSHVRHASQQRREVEARACLEERGSTPQTHKEALLGVTGVFLSAGGPPWGTEGQFPASSRMYLHTSSPQHETSHLHLLLVCSGSTPLWLSRLRPSIHIAFLTTKRQRYKVDKSARPHKDTPHSTWNQCVSLLLRSRAASPYSTRPVEARRICGG
jgi:hypothetical protein